jgi:dihydrofolate reductase
MRKIVLFIATTLDGYIARPDGSLDWLTEGNDDLDFGYDEFLESIDTTIMGSNTYQQVLGFGEFPYKNKVNYIFSKNSIFEENEYIKIVSDNQLELIRDLKKDEGKDIWLIGGSVINSLLLENDLIDKIILFIKSVALGEGIPLFAKSESYLKSFKLADSHIYSEKFIKLIYLK